MAEPFAINRNTTWNANGYITSAATTRIRNVRRGDKYPGHAYYGDAGQNNNPAFFAVDLATGTETLLGNTGALSGGGSFGIRTVLERGGYLYVQTTDNGIQVYPMNSATSLGTLLVTYEKWTLDMVTGNTGQFYGLDVSPDGKRLVFGAAPGLVHELCSPLVGATMIGSELQLSWPASVNAVII